MVFHLPRSTQNWLVDRDVLSPKNYRRIPRVKDRKDYREESNPAFFPDEFRVFKDVLYKFDKDVDDDVAVETLV